MFGDLNDLNASRGFISINSASCSLDFANLYPTLYDNTKHNPNKAGNRTLFKIRPDHLSIYAIRLCNTG